jgi:hypothetical protein
MSWFQRAELIVTPPKSPAFHNEASHPGIETSVVRTEGRRHKRPSRFGYRTPQYGIFRIEQQAISPSAQSRRHPSRQPAPQNCQFLSAKTCNRALPAVERMHGDTLQKAGNRAPTVQMQRLCA